MPQAKPSIEFQESLGLEGDGDEVEFLQDVEEAFGVSFVQLDVADVRTLGDLYDVLSCKLSPSRKPRSICLSAVTFYRLRRALRDCGLDGPITPKSSLADLIGDRSVRSLWRALDQTARLRMPEPGLSGGAVIIELGLVAIGVAVSIYANSLLPAVLAILLAWGLAMVLPQALPHGSRSVTDLIESIVALNYARLSRRHGVCHPDELWRALRIIARDSSGSADENTLGRETRLLA